MIAVFLHHCLFLWCFLSGITAEDVSEVHYQLENSSVCLHVKAQPPYVNAQWLLAKKVLVVSDHINPTFANRMEYFSGNSSLCIKNLTDADSGVYGFSFTTSSFVSIIEEHKIVLQGKEFSYLGLWRDYILIHFWICIANMWYWIKLSLNDDAADMMMPVLQVWFPHLS